MSRAEFHCNRLTTVQDIQDYASLIFGRQCSRVSWMVTCRLESSKTLVAEAQSIDELVTSHEQQLSRLAYLSADSATLRQTRQQLEVCFVRLSVNRKVWPMLI